MANTMSLLSRRNLVLGLAGTAAVGVTVGTVSTQGSEGADAFARLLEPVGLGSRGVQLATGSVHDWRLQVGSKFTAQTGHVLQLANVQSFPDSERPEGLRDRAFVARFDVVQGGALPGSQTYRVSHGEGGTFDMHVTSGDPAKPLRMLAVFG